MVAVHILLFDLIVQNHKAHGAGNSHLLILKCFTFINLCVYLLIMCACAHVWHLYMSVFTCLLCVRMCMYDIRIQLYLFLVCAYAQNWVILFFFLLQPLYPQYIP